MCAKRPLSKQAISIRGLGVTCLHRGMGLKLFVRYRREQEHRSEHFADPHAESVAVSALGNVSSKVDMIFLIQFEPQPDTTARKEFLFRKELTPTGNDAASTSEGDQAKPLR